MPLRERVTTVEAPKSVDLVTLQIVKEELGKTGTADDALLTRYITWASKGIADECNRDLVKVDVIDKFLPALDRGRIHATDTSGLLQLSGYPIIAVASVTEDTTTLIEGTDFLIDAENGRLLRLNGFGTLRSWAMRPITIAYSRGYDPIDPVLVDIATRMVKNRWNGRSRDPYLRSENIPGVREATWWIATGNEAGNFPPDVNDLLSNFRMPIFA
jgi:hypothetical protein